MTLQKLWADFPFTYKSVMSSGFPNFFHIMVRILTSVGFTGDMDKRLTLRRPNEKQGPNAPVASQSIHMVNNSFPIYSISSEIFN